MKQITGLVAGLLSAALVGCNSLVDVLSSDAKPLEAAGNAGAGGAQAGGGRAGAPQAGGGQAGEAVAGGAAGASQGEGGQAGNPYTGGWAGSYSGEMLSGDTPQAGLGLPAVRLFGGLGGFCALRQDGAAKCFGGPAYGQSAQPFLSLGAGAPVVQIVSWMGHMCLLRADSAIQCKGDVTSNFAGPYLHFVDLGPGAHIRKLSAGFGFTCALRFDGRVQCWGRNNHGQLGLGHTNTRGVNPGEMGAALSSVDVGPGALVVDIASNSGTTCILRQDGRVQCWGDVQNEWSSADPYEPVILGDQPAEMGVNLPTVDLGSGSPATRLIGGGMYSMCVLRQDGSLKCWGDNFSGQLGLGDSLNRSPLDAQVMGDNLPAVDLNSLGVVQMAMTGHIGNHACALLTDGSVRCWGFDGLGALGNGAGQFIAGVKISNPIGDEPGEMGPHLPSVDLGPGTVVQEVAVGEHATCVLLQDGTIKCWGGGFGVGETNRDRGDEPGEMGASIPVLDLNF